MAAIQIHEERALGALMRLLELEGGSGREGLVADEVKRRLRAAGVKASAMRHDRAHETLSPPGEVGNLIVKLPGTRRGERLMFMGHMDTVPLCKGSKPVRRGRRIVAAGKTGLGADNRTAVACLVTLVETLLKQKLPHPPLTVLFTVSEETGLCGARRLKKADLGAPKMAFNIDGGDPGMILVGAIGARHWEARVQGLSAHAGMHPEHGISAVAIAAEAITAVRADGWFGRVLKGRQRGTANVGIIEGGRATNEVTDQVVVRGECRSHNATFVDRLVGAYRKAFDRAASGVRNEDGRAGKVRFRVTHDYPSFRLPKTAPVIRTFCETAKAVGLAPSTLVSDGGLDANWTTKLGIPTVTLGAGQHGAHSLAEYVDINEYLDACRLCVELARRAADGA